MTTQNILINIKKLTNCYNIVLYICVRLHNIIIIFIYVILNQTLHFIFYLILSTISITFIQNLAKIYLYIYEISYI